MKGLEAYFILRDNVQSAFKKVCRVPYALQEQVENELDKLEKKWSHKETQQVMYGLAQLWQQKAHNTLRICWDNKSTINQFEWWNDMK